MKYLSTQAIEAEANRVLRDTECLQLPVPVEVVARRMDLTVERTVLGEEVSGLLVVRNDRGVIGVNHSHPPVRQRFTIAHECGHYVLHRGATELFIDKEFTAVYRDSRSSKGDERAEIQANQFAAALLMPADLVIAEIRRQGFDLGDERALRDLADRFQVSLQTMSYRLSSLDVFSPVRKPSTE